MTAMVPVWSWEQAATRAVRLMVAVAHGEVGFAVIGDIGEGPDADDGDGQFLQFALDELGLVLEAGGRVPKAALRGLGFSPPIEGEFTWRRRWDEGASVEPAVQSLLDLMAEVLAGEANVCGWRVGGAAPEPDGFSSTMLLEVLATRASSCAELAEALGAPLEALRAFVGPISDDDLISMLGSLSVDAGSSGDPVHLDDPKGAEDEEGEELRGAWSHEYYRGWAEQAVGHQVAVFTSHRLWDEASELLADVRDVAASPGIVNACWFAQAAMAELQGRPPDADRALSHVDKKYGYDSYFATQAVYGFEESMDRSDPEGELRVVVAQLLLGSRQPETWRLAGEAVAGGRLTSADLERAFHRWGAAIDGYDRWLCAGAEFTGKKKLLALADLASSAAVALAPADDPRRRSGAMAMLGRVRERQGLVGEAETLWWEAYGLGQPDELVADRLTLHLQRSHQFERALAVAEEMLARGVEGPAGRTLRERIVKFRSKLGVSGERARGGHATPKRAVADVTSCSDAGISRRLAEVHLTGTPCDARQAPDGSFLVAQRKPGRVYRLDHDGAVIDARPLPAEPDRVWPLGDGALLLLERRASSRAPYTKFHIVAADDSSVEVEVPEVSMLCGDATGVYFISDAQVVAFDPDGTERWRWRSPAVPHLVRTTSVGLLVEAAGAVWQLDLLAGNAIVAWAPEGEGEEIVAIDPDHSVRAVVPTRDLERHIDGVAQRHATGDSSDDGREGAGGFVAVDVAVGERAEITADVVGVLRVAGEPQADRGHAHHCAASLGGVDRFRDRSSPAGGEGAQAGVARRPPAVQHVVRQEPARGVIARATLGVVPSQQGSVAHVDVRGDAPRPQTGRCAEETFGREERHLRIVGELRGGRQLPQAIRAVEAPDVPPAGELDHGPKRIPDRAADQRGFDHPQIGRDRGQAVQWVQVDAFGVAHRPQSNEPT